MKRLQTLFKKYAKILADVLANNMQSANKPLGAYFFNQK